MKIDRAEVANLLSESTHSRWTQVSSDSLAKLCRLALEVMDAPVVKVGNADAYSCWLEKCQGSESGPVHSLRGERVRLVRVGEE